MTEMGVLLLKDNTVAEDPRLDRVPVGHTKHLDKYPLTAETLPSKPTSVLAGFRWYTNFDTPMIARIRGRQRLVIGDGDLGRMRGGHSTCLRGWDVRDLAPWWLFYDQLKEGRCVEFAGLRLLSHLNRKRYDITSRWHYFEMQMRDYWPGGSYVGAEPVYSGTSVDAAMQVFSQLGAIPALPRGRAIDLGAARLHVKPEEGISTYRWATRWEDVRAAVGVPDWMPGVPLLNSWGKGYPREVILLDAAGERVLHEGGDFAVVTDR